MNETNRGVFVDVPVHMLEEFRVVTVPTDCEQWDLGAGFHSPRVLSCIHLP
jgi:hypothetical protein